MRAGTVVLTAIARAYRRRDVFRQWERGAGLVSSLDWVFQPTVRAEGSRGVGGRQHADNRIDRSESDGVRDVR
jgi:hypothetical protein